GVGLNERNLEVGLRPIGVGGVGLQQLAPGGDGLRALVERGVGAAHEIQRGAVAGGAGVRVALRVGVAVALKGGQGRLVIGGVKVGQPALQLVYRHAVVHQHQQRLEGAGGLGIVVHGVQEALVGLFGAAVLIEQLPGLYFHVG